MSVFFDKFDPTSVRFQHKMLYDIKYNYDYSNGVQVVLSSGAVGSGKTLMACHLIWLHALENPHAYIGIGRKDLKRLKSTLLKPLLEHRPSNWEVGIDFEYNKTEGIIRLPNGSTIACFSWADGDLERFKGEQFTMFVMDEASENTEDVFTMIKSRLGRVSRVNECIFLLITNPDDPDHWLYKNIISKAAYIDCKLVNTDEKMYNRNYHIYYSLTVQNKHNLKKGYIEGLMASNHSKWIERNLEGKWISFGGEGIYFAYREEKHFFREDYKVDLKYPIHIAFDFNVAEGKPMSACFFQYIDDTFHFFEQAVLQGHTTKLLDDMYNRGLFNYNTTYIINGDAAGFNRGSASNGFNDYDIIQNYLRKMKIDQSFRFKLEVPTRNPEIKVRHNIVNSYLENGLGQNKIKVYQKCYTLNEAFKLTKFKKNSTIEDDSKEYQHIGTAAGYGIFTTVGNLKKSFVIKN